MYTMFSFQKTVDFLNVKTGSSTGLLWTVCEFQPKGEPLLEIKLALVDSGGLGLGFVPPLDESSDERSVQETVEFWLSQFLARGSHVTPISCNRCAANQLPTHSIWLYMVIIFCPHITREENHNMCCVFSKFCQISTLLLHLVSKF